MNRPTTEALNSGLALSHEPLLEIPARNPCCTVQMATKEKKKWKRIKLCGLVHQCLVSLNKHFHFSAAANIKPEPWNHSGEYGSYICTAFFLGHLLCSNKVSEWPFHSLFSLFWGKSNLYQGTFLRVRYLRAYVEKWTSTPFSIPHPHNTSNIPTLVILLLTTVLLWILTLQIYPYNKTAFKNCQHVLNLKQTSRSYVQPHYWDNGYLGTCSTVTTANDIQYSSCGLRAKKRLCQQAPGNL